MMRQVGCLGATRLHDAQNKLDAQNSWLTSSRLAASVHDNQRYAGHVNFEESTRPVTALVCTACGKPCRSDAEQALHTKFTGHTEYVDKVRITHLDAPGFFA